VLLLVWAVFDMLALGAASDAILRENYRSILAAEKMTDAIERQDSAALLVLLDYRDDGATQFREYETQFLQWLGRAKDNVTIEGESVILSRIETGYSEYLVQFSRLLHADGEQPPRQAYRESLLPIFLRVRAACGDLRDLNETTMVEASSRAESVADRAVLSTLLIGLGAILVGTIFILWLSAHLVRPLREMIAATGRLAEGDYTAHVRTSGSDELATLADAFNAMAAKLKSYHDMHVERIIAEKRRVESILRSIDDGIIVIDGDSRIITLNATAIRMLNLEPREIEGRHFLEVVKREDLFELLRSVLETGEPPELDESKSALTVGDGEAARHYQFSVTPVRVDGGRMLGAVLLLRDVTRLKELDRLKSEFVSIASHELRTPLTAMSMSMDLLMESTEGKLNETEHELIAVAYEELRRLHSLINDLLDLSKIESGKLAMELSPVAIASLADKAVEVFEAQAAEKSVELKSEISRVLPAVQADPNKITWVLTNLIANALRFVDKGGRVRISADHVGEWVHVSVADDGPGIPVEQQSRIFDKFVQVKSDKSVGGTGLGLAICKEIVRAHKGTIWVDSEPGRGSTFTFALPAAP
jgi:NtrC-family two-component system sensor histidine kinase KinB